MNHDLDGFEQRTRAALRASADGLDAATRSRLAQARTRAPEARGRRGWFDFRYLAPAGAVAAALLVTVLFVGHGDEPGVNESSAGALYDMELLADADAYELSQETDLEFIEWAASQAGQGP